MCYLMEMLLYRNSLVGDKIGYSLVPIWNTKQSSIVQCFRFADVDETILQFHKNIWPLNFVYIRCSSKRPHCQVQYFRKDSRDKFTLLPRVRKTRNPNFP